MASIFMSIIACQAGAEAGLYALQVLKNRNIGGLRGGGSPRRPFEIPIWVKVGSRHRQTETG